MVRICLAGLVVSVFVGLIVTVIVVNSPRHASLEAGGCPAGGGPFEDFRPVEPARPVAATPFFEDGEVEKTIADYRGLGVVMNFWATWCAPCVREMPALDRLQGKVSDRGVQVLALSGDREGAAKVEKFYRDHAIANLAVLIDRRAKVRRRQDVDVLPTTLLIDGRGNEVGRVIGPAEWDTSETVAYILGCLAGGGS